MPVPAVLCVDVEPDDREVPCPAPDAWRGFEATVLRIPAIRAALGATSGRPAPVAWFLRLDPQVAVAHGRAGWSLDRYGTELRGFADAGDELGLHVHAWRRDEHGWVSDLGDPAWVAECADLAFDTYEAWAGRPCRAYRGGDRFVDPGLLARIARRGVTVDLTVEPGVPSVPGLRADERSTGTIPGVPSHRLRPYFPSVADPFAPGVDRGLLAIPLTAAPPYPGARSEPLLLWSSPRLFRARLESLTVGGPPTHLAFAVRTDVFTDPVLGEWVLTNLGQVTDHIGDAIEWSTPQVAAATLRATGAVEPAGGAGASPSADDSDLGRRLATAAYAAEVDLAVARRAHADTVTRLDAANMTVVERERTIDALRAAVGDRDAQLAALRGTRWWRARSRAASLVRWATRRTPAA